MKLSMHFDSRITVYKQAYSILYLMKKNISLENLINNAIPVVNNLFIVYLSIKLHRMYS